MGVTTMEATTGALPVFMAVNEDMSPEPLDANPILEWSFVQVYVVVPTVFVLEKLTAPVLSL